METQCNYCFEFGHSTVECPESPIALFFDEVDLRQPITKAAWDAIHADFKVGDPREGTAAVLKWVDGIGTCLVPVVVKIARPAPKHTFTGECPACNNQNTF
jgi:hypothetical protein